MEVWWKWWRSPHRWTYDWWLWSSDAKLEELGKWKANKVYEPVPLTGHKYISTRWVLTDKIIGGERKVKARLVARGFEEKNEELMKDSPTCAKESPRHNFAIMATRKWKIHSIDIKAAFLQSRPVDRKVYLQPPVEAEVENTIWELKTCIYGLGDASRSWYLSVREQLTKLEARAGKYDPAIFYWHFNGQFMGIMSTHEDDFCWGGESVLSKMSLTHYDQYSWLDQSMIQLSSMLGFSWLSKMIFQ